MSFNKRSQALCSNSLSMSFPFIPSLSRTTYHLEGILHRLRYLNCHRPKSYVYATKEAKYIQSFILIRSVILRFSPPIPTPSSSSPSLGAHSIRKFQLWWHEVDDDDYNGDNNQKLCENNEQSTRSCNNKIKPNYSTNSISIL